MAYRLRSVNVGKALPMLANGRTVSTAIGKRAVSGPSDVHPLGIADDEQADLKVHGGISKAVYAYPHEHYEHWQTIRSQAQASLWNESLPDGFFGENLTLEGLLEKDVWIGDVLEFRSCQLAVSEPRTPCFKFNALMGFPQASLMMVQSGWCGFYLAVRTPGVITPGETFSVAPGPRHIGIAEQFRALTKPKR